MSTRASLLADPSGELVEVGESVSWIPLLWISLLSSDDLDELEEGTVVMDASEAIERCTRAVPFLKGLFPEFTTMQQVAEDFVGLLRRSEADSIGIQLFDHIAMNPDTFLASLEAGVAALESTDADASFTLPATSEKQPFVDKIVNLNAEKLKTSRDLLCLAASMNPLEEDEQTERDQLIGYLLLENYSQNKNGPWKEREKKRRVKPVNYRNKPCPKCGQPLRTNNAMQCFSCGADWH
jgi:hypothetical protein